MTEMISQLTCKANFTHDMWVVAAEVRVEDRAHVHHAVVTINEPGDNKPLGALEVKVLSQTGSDRPLSVESRSE